MKKLILSLAFVLATGGLLNASIKEIAEDSKVSCTEAAIKAQTDFEEFVDMETANDMATYVYYMCVLNGGNAEG